MSKVEDIIEGVIATEGGYVNNPNDKGGETMYGITVAVARANGYQGAMRAMPKDVARSIYRQRYVVEPKFDQVLAVNAAIGEELIDTGVNMGPGRAAEFFQRWLNGFNSGGRYQAVFVDSRLGPISINALKSFLAWRGAAGATAMLRGLNGVQATRYLELTERDPKQKEFLFGWITNRVA